MTIAILSQILAPLADAGELVYVIAVLILAAGSALFEKIRHKMAESQQKSRPQRPGVPPRPAAPQPPQRPVLTPRPERPAAPPVARPRPPVPQRERPRPPQAAPPLPPARRPQPAGQQRPVRTQPPAQPARQAPPLRKATPLRSALRASEDAARTAGPVMEAVAKASAAVERPLATTPAPRPLGGAGRLTSADLRRAIVLRELLGPPISLRDESAESAWL